MWFTDLGWPVAVTGYIIPIVAFIIGLVLIIKGGDFFVDASSWIAEANGIPKILVGATIVSFATTLPELLVSVIGAINSAMGSEHGNAMAVGNAIGSVTANIGLIFALLLVACPGKTKRSEFMVKGLLMLGAAVTLAVFGLIGELNWIGSIMLLLIFAVFTYLNIKDAKTSLLTAKEDGAERPVKTKKTITVNVIKFILGAAGIAGGAFLLVDSGEYIATDILYVPVPIVSAIFVAIGTSLPELVTAITAIVKKQGALSMGNIIGANIIDLAVILPVCSFILGGSVPFAPQNMYLDMPVCLLVGAIALVPTMIDEKIRRSQGIALLVVYAAYLVVMVTCFA